MATHPPGLSGLLKLYGTAPTFQTIYRLSQRPTSQFLGEGRGGKGREGKKCFCRPHNRQFFQHFPLFGRFSAERKRTPPPNPDVSVSNAPFSPRNSFSALIFGRKRIFDPTFGQFSTFIFWGPPSGLVREASRAGSSSNPVAQPFSVQPASLGNFVIDGRVLVEKY